MLQAAKSIIRNGRFVNRIPAAISYHMHLDKPEKVRKLQYMYRGSSIVYGVRCQIDNRIYIGSTMEPGLRFHKHLVSHERSNADLQEAMDLHGVGKFTVQVFEVVSYPGNATYKERKELLTQREQLIINQIPKQQLYNSINASASSTTKS